MQSDGPLEPAGDKANPKEAISSPPSVEIETNSAQDVSSSSASTPTAKGMFLELCAGSAMLSKCFHEQGFTVMPVDHQQNRFHPLSKICNLSLTLDSSWKYLHWLAVTFTILFCHAAPPCGTCSRARELPGGPPPLRNEAYPWGFDDLTPEQSARVEAANKIYCGLATFVELLISLGIYFAIENPTNSLLWLLPIWGDKILKHAFFVTFDACVYGGSRKNSQNLSDQCSNFESNGTKMQWWPFAFAFWTTKAAIREICLCNSRRSCLSQAALFANCGTGLCRP